MTKRLVASAFALLLLRRFAPPKNVQAIAKP